MATGMILVATDSAVIPFDGGMEVIGQGVTTVREGHPILAGSEHLFTPLVPTYEVEEEQAPAKPPAAKAPAKAAAPK